MDFKSSVNPYVENIPSNTKKSERKIELTNLK